MNQPTRRYAEGSKASPMKTLMEIQTLLRKKGASEFGTYASDQMEGIVWMRNGITYRATVNVPQSEDEAKSKVRDARDSAKAKAAHGSFLEAERARKLRSLLLIIKSRLVAVDDEIATFEEAFVGDIVRQDGQTVAKAIARDAVQAVEQGRAPKSLGWGGS